MIEERVFVDGALPEVREGERVWIGQALSGIVVRRDRERQQAQVLLDDCVHPVWLPEAALRSTVERQ